MTTKWEINKAVRASKLPAPSRLIMLTLSDIAEAGTAEIPEQFTPSLRVLADETGLNKATVKRHLSDLEAAGWIDRVRPSIEGARLRGERTCYKLTLPPETDLGAQDAYLGAESAQTMAQRAPSHGAESAHPRRTVRHIDKEPDLYQISPDQPDLFLVAEAPSKPAKAPAKAEDDPEFLEWYAGYARHVARPEAHKAYRKALTKISHADLLAKTVAWVAAERERGTQQQYLPHPATWLNREQWNDPIRPPDQPRTNGHQSYRNPEDMSIYERDL